MKLLDDHQALRAKIFEYFGYVEDYRVLPLDDARRYFWELHQAPNGHGTVRFADTQEDLADDHDDSHYENEIYTQRFLPKWVYRGKNYTMIVVDTHTDGNQFLSIFDNAKECSTVTSGADDAGR